MHPSHITLLVVTIVVNLCLWAEYAVMNPHNRDFGAVKGGMRVYMLLAAAVAYACNLAYIGLVAAAPLKRLKQSQVDAVTVATAVYYVLQLAFLPLVRVSLKSGVSKFWVQSVLLLCILPMAVLAIVAVQIQNPALIALSTISLLHVTINDAVLFGGMF
jgi:hypothetical protein